LFLDLSNASSSTDGRELHDSTEQGKDDKAENTIRQAEVRNGTLRVVDDMSRMRERWAEEFDTSGPYYHLSTYYVALKLYASSLLNNKDGEGAYLGEGMFGAYVGDEPDSAIEVNESNESDDAASFKSIEIPPKAVSPSPSLPEISPISPIATQYLEDVSELMEEMIDIPSRPPTPPPKDLKRLVAIRSSMVSPFDPPVNEPMVMYGVVTQITTGNKRPTSSLRPPSRTGAFGRWLGHIKNAVSETPSSHSGRIPTSSSSSSDTRPMTPILQASLVRRGSRRLSTSIKRLPLWSTELEEPDNLGIPGSNAVFGVSLSKSMQTAKSSAKTHHNGSGSSRREFPLCIHKCVNFLQQEGLEAPHIFSEPGDGFRVQKLKETFSAAPKYGENLDWNNYGVYDAADIILIYLSQLPKPLITESIAKRWISLSKQATLSGSHGTRLDQCIDFWEETLLGLRGPARSLFKLLLNLWSSIADSAEQNEMTAERLASVLLKPLMHTSSEKYSTDYMLSLAFLIRKRSEYVALMNSRESRAAW
jgi:GTPase-activating protein SAC7